jgi:hypothetical protein
MSSDEDPEESASEDDIDEIVKDPEAKYDDGVC